MEYKGTEWEDYSFNKSDVQLEEEKAVMSQMHYSYIAFYYRLESEKINLEGESCILEVGSSKLSPIFQYYENDFQKWPYNWENISLSGAPSSYWLIENDSLFLSKLELKSKTNFKGPETTRVDLDSLNVEKTKSGKCFVSKVNGVYLIKHGYFPKEKENPRMYEFIETGYTLINVKNGLILEKYYLEKNFDFEEPGKMTNPKILKLILRLK